MEWEDAVREIGDSMSEGEVLGRRVPGGWVVRREAASACRRRDSVRMLAELVYCLGMQYGLR